MAHLTKLTLSNASRLTGISSSESRRIKLLARLDEQLAMAAAFVANQPYTATRKILAVDEHGNKQRVDREKRLSAWYWRDADGNFMFELRHGARRLELAKGKYVVNVGSKDKLVEVIRTVIEAVKCGELDAALTVASAKHIKATKT